MRDVSKTLVCLTLGFLLSGNAVARYFGPPELMPAPAGSALYDETDSSTTRNSIGVGVELGSVARKSNISDLAGMEVMVGGRVFMRLSILRKVFVEPALGFFFRPQGATPDGLNDYTFEAGARLYYTPLSPRRLQWYIGTAQRVEAVYSTIVPYPGDPTLTNLAFRFRLGPATGLAYALSRDMSLVTDLEATAEFTNPIQPYFGWTVGLILKY